MSFDQSVREREIQGYLTREEKTSIDSVLNRYEKKKKKNRHRGFFFFFSLLKNSCRRHVWDEEKQNIHSNNN